MTIKWIRQNEVNDIFEVTENGNVRYVEFPRSMEMTTQDAEDHLTGYDIEIEMCPRCDTPHTGECPDYL